MGAFRDFGQTQFALVAGFVFAVVVALTLLRALLSLVYRVSGVPTVVLKDYRVSRSPVEGAFVYISGRPPGLWSFFMTLIGLGTEVRFTVSKKAVERESERWNLFPFYSIDSVPIFNVASTHFGFAKNGLYLVLGLVLLLAAAGAAVPALQAAEPAQALNLFRTSRDTALVPVVGLGVLGLLFLLGYVLSKRVEIQVDTGRRTVGVRFKPSLLGRLSVDYQELVKVVEIINSLIVRGPVGQPVHA